MDEISEGKINSNPLIFSSKRKYLPACSERISFRTRDGSFMSITKQVVSSSTQQNRLSNWSNSSYIRIVSRLMSPINSIRFGQLVVVFDQLDVMAMKVNRYELIGNFHFCNRSHSLVIDENLQRLFSHSVDVSSYNRICADVEVIQLVVIQILDEKQREDRVYHGH